MKCPKCDFDNPDNTSFCGNCAAPLQPEKSGEVEIAKAREMFEELTQLTTGRIWWGDLYAKSFYMLGKIHQEEGRESEAIDNYEKFRDLWKNADPGFEEVDYARAQLAALKK